MALTWQEKLDLTRDALEELQRQGIVRLMEDGLHWELTPHGRRVANGMTGHN